MFRQCFRPAPQFRPCFSNASVRIQRTAHAKDPTNSARWRSIAGFKRNISQSRWGSNRLKLSQGTIGILATILFGGFAVSYGISTTQPLALEGHDPDEEVVHVWDYKKYEPLNGPCSLVRANEMLRWDEGSQAVGGSVVRTDYVQIPSNFPPEDVLMQTKAMDGPELLWLITGVFDGHAGFDTAQALQKYMIHYLIRELNAATAEPLSSKEADRAITRAFLDLDEDIMQVATRAIEGARLLADALAEVVPAYSGSCALVSYYNEASRELKVACTGDSRAVLGRRNNAGQWEAIPLSFDQTGFNKSEVARLEVEHPNEPDMIKQGRLLGLALTRAFGDGRWKWPRDIQEKAQERFFGPETREPLLTPPYLTAEPVITTALIDPDKGDFLIMASDGLWDCLTNEQAVDLVGRWLETYDVTKPAPTPDLAKAMPDILAPSDLSKRMEPVPDAKYTTRKKITEKDYVVVDENAARHLARHACGGGNEDLLTGMGTANPPLLRKLRDDISVQVIFFGKDPNVIETI